MLESRYLNPVWPESVETSQAGWETEHPWWTNYFNAAGFAAIGGATGARTASNETEAVVAMTNALGSRVVVIAESSFAEPIVGVGANFQLGDFLMPPEGVNSNVAPVLNFMGGPTCAVWLDYANLLIASDMGAVQVTWTLADGSVQTVTYTVSPNPTRRPVRLYWTEGQNAGPTITFASTYSADIHYNSQVTTNHVWIDANQLHASRTCPSGSRFLLTYSRVVEATRERELLAYEIVEVLEPMSSTLPANVGQQLLSQNRPYPISDLFATITRGVIDPAGQETPYVYQHQQGAKNGWVWAIRETAPGEAWHIEIYWKAKEELDVLWPFEVDNYAVTWGTNAQVFVRGALGDAEPRVYFPDDIQVELMPHFSPDTHVPTLEAGVFYTVDEGYCLLKYTVEDDVWFEPVHSIPHDDPRALAGASAWEIPREIRPIDGAGDLLEETHGQWPGYVYTNAGTAYNIGRYGYPAAYTAPDQAASYIFPVNVGPLEVWWSNPSAQQGLPKPVFFPSLADRYDCDWPAQPKAITIASGLGSEGATEDLETSCMRFDRGELSLEEAQLLGCHLDCSAPNGLDMASQFTLELWLKPDTLTGSQSLIDKGANYSLRLNAGVPELRTGGRLYGAAATLSAHEWQHLAVTVSAGGAVTFYVGENETSSAPFTGRLTADASHLRLGARASDGITPEDFYSGLMDEVRIWSVARTKDDIRNFMRFSVDTGAAGLRAYYRFNRGEWVEDSSNFRNRMPLPAAGVRFEQPGIPQTQPGIDLSGVDISLYVQNDRNVHGFNPNEEHAIIFQNTVYALRCDLNITERSDPAYTSDPFVLLDGQSPLVADGRPFMLAFGVIPSNSIYAFERFLTAGLMIQPPYPISLMQPSNCSSNKQVNSEIQFRDRKGYYWARQAGDMGGPTNYVFDYYYPMQSSFFFPDRDPQPPVGWQIPWLDRLAGDGTPLDFTHVVEWPTNLPVLHIGDTLTVARDELPAIRGQLSVDVVYQQSAALGGGESVTLIDPTRARKAPLDDQKLVTERMKSYRDVRTACWYFNDLPPDLRDRLFYNPNAQTNQELQLIGEYRTRSDNHNYLLLNLLDVTNRAAATDESLMSGISGDGGVLWRNGIAALPSNVFEIVDNTTPFDSLALPTTGLGTGYVTVVFNDSTNRAMVDPSENIDMKIFRVSPELYQGKLDDILSPNPLDKQISLYYTADFRGTPERWEFQWEYGDPDNGSAPLTNDTSKWHHHALGAGINHVTVGDSGVFGLSDHYLRCRYRALDGNVQAVVGTNWSSWTDPQLCEGWIKRVLKAINPFEQRIRDFMNYEVLTDLSMVQQIGAPYDGDIPLNYDALNEYGLMQIYETLNSQADSLSVDAGLEADGALALALLMVKGRLSDLYMVLGHEAYGDAMDPTIYLGATDPVTVGEAPSLFCFQNQEPNLLAEELALLRGRDADMNPPVTQYPTYNRLAWNITADIVGGQVAYMLNYGISDLKGNTNGVLDPEDAAILFPQGHGDAYGHYLSALKGYYQYLHNPYFSWLPQVEGILVDDTEVTVSYLHEKKFAVASAARARAGVAVIAATQREDYEGEDGWRVARDSNTNRAWGAAEWGCRVGMGTYFDWLTGNSLLPPADPDPTHEGIRVIDRENVAELYELIDLGNQAQQQVDLADAGLNPLGLAPDAVPFDISSSEIDAGKTHFEQIYDRALQALRSALAVSMRVRRCAQAIRDQNEASDLDSTVLAEEAAIERRLLEIYGYPYEDDIGPGKLYPQGYEGPDLIQPHYLYVETWALDPAITNDQRTLHIAYTTNIYVTTSKSFNLRDGWGSAGNLYPATDFTLSYAREEASGTFTAEVNVANNGIPVKPPGYSGKRRAEGEIQVAVSEYLTAIDDLYSAFGDAQYLNDQLKRKVQSWESTYAHRFRVLNRTYTWNASIRAMQVAIDVLKTAADFLEFQGRAAKSWGEVVQASIPFNAVITGLSPGTINELPLGKSIASQAAATTGTSTDWGRILAKAATYQLESGIRDMQNTLAREIAQMDVQEEGRQMMLELQGMIQQQGNSLSTLEAALQKTETAKMKVTAAIAEGDRLQAQRARLRMNWAADLNTRRYRNMAYRLFMNDELVRYRQAFDLTARYVYLAAKAYDYETGLIESDAQHTAGSEFMQRIVKARALGRFSDWTQAEVGEPLVGGPAGDPGLADAMARMKANWDVLKGRLSFNNPQQETGRFSLRQECFRITTNAASDANWEVTLVAHKVANLRDLPEFVRYCLPFDPMLDVEPAIVIPFSTTIDFRRNVFGLPLAAGDNAYDSTHFATKIRSVGVWFSNFNSAFDSGLANQPRVYLVPAGVDSMRVPIGTTARTRQWSVVDQALPLPYPITDSEWAQPDWSMLENVLGNELYKIRRFPSMLAYHDGGDQDAMLEVTWNSRLVGRSVWNSRWVLVIPGGTLLADADEGLERFIHGRKLASGARDGNGVKDIKLYFHTYSYSGN